MNQFRLDISIQEALDYRKHFCRWFSNERATAGLFSKVNWKDDLCHGPYNIKVIENVSFISYIDRSITSYAT